jgi:hypothetical protein
LLAAIGFYLFVRAFKALSQAQKFRVLRADLFGLNAVCTVAACQFFVVERCLFIQILVGPESSFTSSFDAFVVVRGVFSMCLGISLIALGSSLLLSVWRSRNFSFATERDRVIVFFVMVTLFAVIIGFVLLLAAARRNGLVTALAIMFALLFVLIFRASSRMLSQLARVSVATIQHTEYLARVTRQLTICWGVSLILVILATIILVLGRIKISEALMGPTSATIVAILRAITIAVMLLLLRVLEFRIRSLVKAKEHSRSVSATIVLSSGRSKVWKKWQVPMDAVAQQQPGNAFDVKSVFSEKPSISAHENTNTHTDVRRLSSVLSDSTFTGLPDLEPAVPVAFDEESNLGVHSQNESDDQVARATLSSSGRERRIASAPTSRLPSSSTPWPWTQIQRSYTIATTAILPSQMIRSSTF